MSEYKPKLPARLYVCLYDGLQMLLALRLKGCPSIDTINATVQAWDTALAHGKKLDSEADMKRFQDCFAILAAEINTWPTPADFLAKLPKREEPEMLRLDYSFAPTEQERAKAKEEISKLNKLLENAPCMNRSWIHGTKGRSVEECIAIYNQKRRKESGKVL
ncbi:hypothetical protein LVJ85_05660 [Neisseria sp. Dent CA1/247]|uniref:hypothetical protein n=1 Tax=Neisseria sp. Dent CA1/247 TaxID=2912675 RepID=UPI001FD3B9F7|nr:hypothetical protein [Neisseria sp. Dent CA1/247]UOO77948.1 hypothetical protein LVJ85_05660 [Neisseria sp. Dent CA1/247]